MAQENNDNEIVRELAITFKIEGKVNGQEVADKLLRIKSNTTIAAEDLTLNIVRNQIQAGLGVAQGWKFLSESGALITDEEGIRVKNILNSESDKPEIRIKVTALNYQGGEAKYKLTFEFEGEEKLYTSVIRLNVGPAEATLDKIREKVNTNATPLRNDKVKWKFNFANGSEVKDEANTSLLDVSDPVEETIDGLTTFTATLKVEKKKGAGTWNGNDVITDPELIAALESGEAEEVPDSFPELPEANPITDVTDFQAWHQLEAEKRLAVVRYVARLTNGFNYPDMEAVLDSVGKHNEISPQSVGLPQLQRFVLSSADRWIIGPKDAENVTGNTSSKESYSKTNSGYTRLAVEKRRNLAVTTALKVKVPDYGAIDAEYSRAEAQVTTSKEENLFLFHETWINKAEVTLPLSTDGTILKTNENKLRRNYAFYSVCDRANTPEDIYRILEDWGALIATKVTVGGAHFVANVLKKTEDFNEEKIKNAWKLKVDTEVYGIQVGATNQGELNEEQKSQLNTQFASKVIKTIGGVEELGINSQYGEWLATLSNVDLWKPLNREGILPIYVVLDKYRKARFARILMEGGAARWQKNTICRSLKYTNFDWYVSFGQKSVDDRLG